MNNKIEWSATLLTIIAAILGFLGALINNNDFFDFYYKYEGPILLIMLPLLSVLFATYTINLVKILISKNRIFVSYSHKDKETADQIINYLKSSPKMKYANIIITSDKDLKMGDDIMRSTSDKISEAGFIILLVSDNYLSSSACAKELAFIKDKKQTIIPILLPSLTSFDNVPENVKRYKGVILPHITQEDISKEVNKIIDDITKS